jgi:hypothetical protein
MMTKTPYTKRTLPDTPIKKGQCWYSNSDNRRILLIERVDIGTFKAYGINTKTLRPFAISILRFGSGRASGFSLLTRGE